MKTTLLTAVFFSVYSLDVKMNIQIFFPLVNLQEIIDDLNLKVPKICHLYAIYPYNMNKL